VAGPLAHAALFIVLGGAFGFLGGLFGLGGGIIAIPILGVFFGMSEQVAQGTSLVMIVPNTLLGLWGHIRKGGFDLKVAAMLGGTGCIFTLLASQVATHVSSHDLRIAFAIFLLAIAAYLSWRVFGPSRDAETRRLGPIWAIPIGAIGGLFSGLFSIGGATFAVPATTWAFGYSQVLAQGMALAMVAPGTLVGIGVYGVNHDIDWPAGLALAAGGAATVTLGVNLSYKLPNRVLRILFIALVILATVGMLVTAR
jgi:uncharacterized membrane protein YfcA